MRPIEGGLAPGEGAHTCGEMWQLVQDDTEQYQLVSAEFLKPKRSLLRTISIMTTPAGMSASCHRLAHWAWCRGWRRVALLITRINFLLTKADIAPNAVIGPGLYIAHPYGVCIYANVGARAILYPQSHVISGEIRKGDAGIRPATCIGDDVVMSTFATAWGGARVGNRCNFGPSTCADGDVIEDDTVLLSPGGFTIMRRPDYEPLS